MGLKEKERVVAQNRRFVIAVIVIQILFIILFALFVDYESKTAPSELEDVETPIEEALVNEKIEQQFALEEEDEKVVTVAFESSSVTKANSPLSTSVSTSVGLSTTSVPVSESTTKKELPTTKKDKQKTKVKLQSVESAVPKDVKKAAFEFIERFNANPKNKLYLKPPEEQQDSPSAADDQIEEDKEMEHPMFPINIYKRSVDIDGERRNFESILTRTKLYDLERTSDKSYIETSDDISEYKMMSTYSMFQDVHVMMFVGFGFLMTFLKRYGYSSVGINFLLAAICIQWATLCQGFFHMHNGKVEVDIKNLLNADFASATVLISFGAVLGKTTPLQLIVMAMIEIAIFATNEWLGLDVFMASDIGASMFVHVFGAYFGLMCSLAMKRDYHSQKEGAVYHSDVFAMIGTIFLWLFWPSFNAGPGVGDQQHRAVINTYYSLASCCVTAFAVSALVSKDHKLNMVHIQNSTLAGGVAIGTAADMMIHPFGAMIVGAVAGTISVLGYQYLTPKLHKVLGLHDTCGVHNLHGMPGLLAAIVGAIVAAAATDTEYSYNLYRIFKARAPLEGSEDYNMLKINLLGIEPGLNRTGLEQGAYQIVALAVTLLLATVGGLCTGLILRLPIFGTVPKESLFDDEAYWEVPEEEDENHESPAEEAMFTVHKRDIADSKM